MSQKGHGNDLRIQAFVALLVADFFLTADYSVFPAAVLQVIRWLQLAGRLVSKSSDTSFLHFRVPEIQIFRENRQHLKQMRCSSTFETWHKAGRKL